MMTEILQQYLLFLGQALTVVVSLAACLSLIHKKKETINNPFSLKIVHWNKQLNQWKRSLTEETLDKKTRKKSSKKKKKNNSQNRVFVIHFSGDIHASAVNDLKDLVTALLTTSTAKDEILVVIDSKGGAVNSYGLAASQLARIREAGIPLTVAIDQVAASGGYLMACIADHIIAAPFAIVGSIGVIMQVPNFSKWLKKHDIQVEEITAGEDKRHLTTLTDNTPEDRAKARQQAEDIHQIFKQYIVKYRPQVDLKKVDSGAFWLAEQAKELNLVDTLITSDAYLQKKCLNKQVYLISKHTKKKRLHQLKSLLTQYCRQHKILI